MEYYVDEDCFRATDLLEELVTIYRGSSRGEKVYYYYANCLFSQDNYIYAAYHYARFSQTYPNSEFAEECEFLSAKCYYYMSPNPNLDQENTHKAIEALQLFLNKHPGSSYMEECNKMINKLRDKLETKAYDIAKLYFKMGYYKSAIIALKNNLKDYPDTKYREDILFHILKSGFLLAENSVQKKQNERYSAAIDYYYQFVAEYPESKYLKEAERFFKNAEKQLSIQ